MVGALHSPPPSPERAAFLFCDIVRSTTILGSLGLRLGEETRRRLFDALRADVHIRRGEVVKGRGDGLVARFRTVDDAVTCAAGMHATALRTPVPTPTPPLRLRVGIAAGPAVEEEGDWYGEDVTLAARLVERAAPGQTLVAVSDDDPVPFPGRGRRRLMSLRGFPTHRAAIDADAVPRPAPRDDDPADVPDFVGRDEERGVLDTAWGDTLAGTGRIVLIRGGPGSGRGRLLSQFIHDAAAAGGRVAHPRAGGLSDAVAGASPAAPVIVALRCRGPDESELLREVARLAETGVPSGALVVLIADDAASAADPNGVLDALGQRPGIARVDLVGLTAQDVAVLALEMLGGPDRPALSADVHRVSEGHARLVITLLRRLRRDPTAPVSVPNPYKGLLSLEADDVEVFFGRAAEVADLAGRVRAGRAVAVVGPSGSGKSSLVRAGIIPQLRGDPDPWRVVLVRPGGRPVDTLQAALDRLGGIGRRVIVVDQVEEIVTQTADDAERGAFAAALAGARARGIAVVLALRVDLYAPCVRIPGLGPLLTEDQFILEPPDTAQLDGMVRRPAEHVGLRLEPGLAEQVLRDVADAPGALPLVSHAMRQTCERRRGRTLTMTAYREIGGALGALAQTAEEVHLSLDERGRADARAAFLRLAEPGEGGVDTSRRLIASEIGHGPEAARTHDALEPFAAARLVVADADGVMLAHEALLREWPRLRGWLNEDREARATLRHLTQAARGWEERGRDPGELYRGARLAGALELLQTSEFVLAPRERDFLAAGRVEQERELHEAHRRGEAQARSNRRLRTALTAAGLGLAAAVVGGVIAVRQEGRADDARRVADARRLAAASGAVLGERPDLAMLLAVEGRGLRESAETRAALFTSLTGTPGLRGYVQKAVTLHGAALDASGRLLAVTGATGVVDVYDVSGPRPRPLRTIRLSAGEHFGEDVSFAPDGTLVVGDDYGLVARWDPRTGRMLARMAPPANAPSAYAVAVSHDGGVVAAAYQDGVVRLWDARTGQLRAAMPAVTDYEALSVAFAPDDRYVLAGYGGEGGQLRLWDTATHHAALPARAMEDFVGAVSVDPRGRRLLAGDGLGRVSVFDRRTGRRLGNPVPAHQGPVFDLAFEDSTTFATSGQDGRVRRWDLATRQPAGDPLAGHVRPVFAIGVSRRSGTLVTAGDDGKVGIWSLAGKGPLLTPLPGHAGGVTEVAVSGDGRLAATAGQDGTVRLWDPVDGTPQGRPIPVGDSPLTAVALDAHGRRLATGGGDGTARVVDLTGVPHITHRLHAADVLVTSVALSADGRWLATTGRDPGLSGRGLLWDLGDVTGTARQVPATYAEGPRRVAPRYIARFAPDGRTLAVGNNLNHVDVATVPDLRPVQAIDLLRGIRGLGFSPDGARMAVGGTTGRLRVFDVRSGRQLAELDGHQGEVAGLAIRPDGRLLASTATDDRQLRLWDLDTFLGFGRPLATGSTWRARLAWTPDGRRLLLPMAPAGAAILDMDESHWVAAACTAAGRNLSRAEWAQYLPAGTAYRPTCPDLPAGA